MEGTSEWTSLLTPSDLGFSPPVTHVLRCGVLGYCGVFYDSLSTLPPQSPTALRTAQLTPLDLDNWTYQYLPTALPLYMDE